MDARPIGGSTRAAWRGARFVVASLVALAALAVDARADSPTLAGTWSSSPMSESITVTSWVDECGPQPKPQGAAGGTYKVSLAGDELVFSGPVPFRSDVCFDMESGRKVSHSAMPALRTWKTRCESAPGDARHAAITTVVRAQGDNLIVVTESAHYSWTMSSGTCAADIERARTLSLVAREGETAASTTIASTAPAAPSAATKTSPACDTLGDAAKLEVFPKKKILRPGERFDFHGKVLDDKGCELPTKVTFRLAPESTSLSPVLAVDPNGRVDARADAEPTSASLLVEAAGKSARVEVEIVSDQRYAELLGTGGIDDAGVDERTVSVTVSGGGGAPSTLVEPPAEEPGKRRLAYLAIAGGSCTLLALAAIVLWRRGRAADLARARRRARLKAKRAESPARERIPQAPTPIALVVVDRAGGVQSSTVLGVAEPPIPAEIGAIVHIRVCPQCGDRYPSDAAFCPIDGERLVAVRDPRGAEPVHTTDEPPAPGRICPVCGKRYARDAGFCGQDGVELVPLN